MNAPLPRRFLVAMSLLATCSKPVPSQGPIAPEVVGAVALAVLVAPGTTIDSASYQITGPQGFARSGSIDVSHGATISAKISGLPAGPGYSIVLSAASTDGATSCSGSGLFDIVAGQTASVTVRLACHEAPRLGGVTATAHPGG